MLGWELGGQVSKRELPSDVKGHCDLGVERPTFRVGVDPVADD